MLQLPVVLAAVALLPTAHGVHIRPKFCDFHPLASPDAYTKLFVDASPDDITIIKWASDGCRTCRAAQPKIRSILKRWDEEAPSAAAFYSMDLRVSSKEGSDDGMFDFFKEKGVTHLPYIELYVGSELVHSLVVPPSRAAFLRNALTDVSTTWRDGRRQRERRRLLLGLRAARARLYALDEQRARERRRWAAMRSTERAGLSASRRAERRRLLAGIRRLATRRASTAAEAAALARRWRLFRRLVLSRRS